MKNRFFLIVTLSGWLGSSACNDEEISGNMKAQWLTAEQIEKNSVLLDSAFSLTGKALEGAGKVKDLVKASDSEEEFIRQMNLVTKNVFDKSIEIAWKIKSEPYSNPEYDAERLMSFNLNAKLIDPLRSFAESIEENSAGRDGHEDEIDIYGIDLSHDNVSEALEVFELIVKHNNPGMLDDAIDDFLAERQSPVLIGLLLPAVQAAREAARRQSGRDRAFEYVMTDIIITSNQTALLMQQQKAAGYLGGLNMLVSDEFNKDSEISVCLEATRAVYLNTVAQLWHQAWVAYH